MAVYTRVEADDLRALLNDYAVGELEDFAGIPAGVTNTNYFVDTSLGRWVLTLFEQVEETELPFFMQLMDHLAAHGVPCAHPVARNDGGFMSRVRGQPAALVYRLAGASEVAPGPDHCRSLGGVVAAMHRAVAGFTPVQRNTRDLGWITTAAERLASVMAADEYNLLTEEIAFQQRSASELYTQLPTAIVHADLFRDNVLFDNFRVSGLIDFYYACRDYLLFDLAVICNDWAVDDDERYHPAHWQAFMAAYTRRRPPDETEISAWPAMLRAAALRFWVSRLIDVHFPMSGEVVHIKDPAPFKRLLLAHRNHAPALLPA